MKNNWRIIIAGFLVLTIISCKNQKKIAEPVRYYDAGKFIIKERYDSLGNLIIKQYLNKDTMPDGPMIEYYASGQIGAWRWFTAKYHNPSCGVFYKQDGSFDTIKGDIILDAIRYRDSSLCFALINPPSLAYIVRFVDSYNGEVVNQKYYEPIKTDSVSWLPIGKYELKLDHEYKIVFCIVDSIKKQILYEFPEAIDMSRSRQTESGSQK